MDICDIVLKVKVIKDDDWKHVEYAFSVSFFSFQNLISCFKTRAHNLAFISFFLSFFLSIFVCIFRF